MGADNSEQQSTDAGKVVPERFADRGGAGANLLDLLSSYKELDIRLSRTAEKERVQATSGGSLPRLELSGLSADRSPAFSYLQNLSKKEADDSYGQSADLPSQSSTKIVDQRKHSAETLGVILDGKGNVEGLRDLDGNKYRVWSGIEGKKEWRSTDDRTSKSFTDVKLSRDGVLSYQEQANGGDRLSITQRVDGSYKIVGQTPENRSFTVEGVNGKPSCVTSGIERVSFRYDSQGSLSHVSTPLVKYDKIGNDWSNKLLDFPSTKSNSFSRYQLEVNSRGDLSICHSSDGEVRQTQELKANGNRIYSFNHGDHKWSSLTVRNNGKTEHAFSDGRDFTEIKFETKGDTDRPERQKVQEVLLNDPAVKAEVATRMCRAMNAFEKRADQQGLAKDETEKTFAQVARLLLGGGDNPIDRQKNIQLAEETLRQAADPGKVSQGHHMTCNVTSLEQRLYFREPALVSEMVADVALNGKYTTIGDRPVTVDVAKDSAENREPDQDARKNDSASGMRSFASQIFQTTAINIHYEKYGRRLRDEDFEAGSLAYINMTARDDQDSGDRLRIKSENKFLSADQSLASQVWNGKRPFAHTAITFSHVMDINEAITGQKSESGKHGPFALSSRHEQLQNGAPNTHDSRIRRVNSSAELEARVKELSAQGRLPLIVTTPHHALCVTAYNPESRKVSVEETWQGAPKHIGADGVTPEQLFNRMRGN